VSTDQDGPDARPPLLASAFELVLEGAIDPAFVISHRLRLEEAPRGYQMFNDKVDDCTKVVLTP
jgi:threonine dehydrogenase-like Zn-dependent dehydrogenase